MKQNSGYDKNSELYKSAYDRITASDKIKSDIRRLEMKKAKKSYSFIKPVAVAAAFCLMFTGLVNTSTAFASSVENIPIIGKIAELVNLSSYTEETEDYAISVSIPAVKDNIGNSDISDSINEEILHICNEIAEEAKERALEYREAFLATGGTVEEWKEHNITITVDYNIVGESSDYLSFVVLGYESWVSSNTLARYYNLNLNTMEYATLEELLGEDYIALANEQIRQQMKERQENSNDTFFTPEEGGFESISEDQSFYINNDGNVVIVFEKYAIAPGYMGSVEFEIK